MYEEKIERYLANEMSTEERKNFEGQLQHDSVLKDEFENTQKALEDLRWHQRMDLKTRLQQVEKTIQSNESQKYRLKFGWMVLGIVIFLILFLIWLRFNSSSTQEIPDLKIKTNHDTIIRHVPDAMPQETIKVKSGEIIPDSKPEIKKAKHTPEEIYAMVYEPYTDAELENQVRGGDEKNDYEVFCNFYYNERYAKAISVYGNLNADLKANERVLLIKANSHLALNQLFPAISILEKLHRDTNSKNKKEICWYLGLCYLRLNRIDEATKLFSDPSLRSDPRSKKVLRAM
jgi:tetratricopeptide (TPR) repeat protein